jgi:hypothetical protein
MLQYLLFVFKVESKCLLLYVILTRIMFKMLCNITRKMLVMRKLINYEFLINIAA